jgi:hypothetical protein
MKIFRTIFGQQLQHINKPGKNYFQTPAIKKKRIDDKE